QGFTLVVESCAGPAPNSDPAMTAELKSRVARRFDKGLSFPGRKAQPAKHGVVPNRTLVDADAKDTSACTERSAGARQFDGCQPFGHKVRQSAWWSYAVDSPRMF